MRWHFVSLDAFVPFHDLLCVYRQSLVGIHHDAEEAGVCLQQRKDDSDYSHDRTSVNANLHVCTLDTTNMHNSNCDCIKVSFPFSWKRDNYLYDRLIYSRSMSFFGNETNNYLSYATTLVIDDTLALVIFAFRVNGRKELHSVFID